MTKKKCPGYQSESEYRSLLHPQFNYEDRLRASRAAKADCQLGLSTLVFMLSKTELFTAGKPQYRLSSVLQDRGF